jgi:hypothetical protein
VTHAHASTGTHAYTQAQAQTGSATDTDTDRHTDAEVGDKDGLLDDGGGQSLRRDDSL